MQIFCLILFSLGFYIGGERVPLVVFGFAKLQNIKISAMLSGLTLEANLKNVSASATHREKVKGRCIQARWGCINLE